MRIRYFGHTDVGLSRDHNEDSHLADPDLGVFVVADGVGGQEGFGLFEHFCIGRHDPSGFADWLSVAP